MLWFLLLFLDVNLEIFLLFFHEFNEWEYEISVTPKQTDLEKTWKFICTL